MTRPLCPLRTHCEDHGWHGAEAAGLREGVEALLDGAPDISGDDVTLSQAEEIVEAYVNLRRELVALLEAVDAGDALAWEEAGPARIAWEERDEDEEQIDVDSRLRAAEDLVRDAVHFVEEVRDLRENLCMGVVAPNAWLDRAKTLTATESRKEAPHAAPAKTPPLRDGAVHTQETEPGAVGEAAPGEGTVERRAPMQGEHGKAKRPSGTITWSEHMEIYAAYAKRYGRDQSAERLAERGGFGWNECVLLLGREPATWKPEAGR